MPVAGGEHPVAEIGALVRRQRWNEAQKPQIVAETHEPGVSVPMVARRYNLNPSQVFRWRRLFRERQRSGGDRPVHAGLSSRTYRHNE